jgi:hypothetical protein
MRFPLVVTLFFLLSGSVLAQTVDIVFDLDWTLVYPLSESSTADPTKVIWAQGKPYRVTDWTSEVLGKLARKKELRISFFSGGQAARNFEILKQIKLPDGRSAFEIAYKMLHFEDLMEVSTDQNLPFDQKYKKSLTKINPDLTRLIMVDDSYEFVPFDQKRNELWLGGTYNFYEKAEDIPKTKGLYDPPSISKWKAERNKLLSAYDAIEMVYRNRKNKDPLKFLPRKLPPPPANPCHLYY